ncbi:MAG TPA: hypothetical protein VIE40_07820, partial [Dehalococcoidia bacterium]
SGRFSGRRPTLRPRMLTMLVRASSRDGMSHDRFGYANYHRVTDQLVGRERTPVSSSCQAGSGGSSRDSLRP